MPPETYVFSVRDLTRYIKTTLERERALQGVLVRGEISNCKYHASGHLYFTLKDDASELRCVMWREQVRQLALRVADGMRVLAEGSITVYERGGQYQLSVYTLRDDGVGNLYQAFERLKQTLQAEGLFDPAHKRPLPSLPRRIALLTSPTGAVAHDFITISTRRWPGRRIVLIPTVVQGPQAPPSIVRGLLFAANLREVDVIVLARGGGSFEELNGFNDERVARAIAASPIPVVSAVGHETDFTIADFVADLRAPTPSAAAELVVPDLQGAENYLTQLRERIFMRARARFAGARQELARALRHPSLCNPQSLIRERQQALDIADERIATRLAARLTRAKARLQAVEGRLVALDPRGVLLRGYALVTRPRDGVLLPTAAEAGREDTLEIRFSDGALRVRTDA